MAKHPGNVCYTDDELAYVVMRLNDLTADTLGVIAEEIGRGREGLFLRLKSLGLPTTPVNRRSPEQWRAAINAKALDLAALDREAAQARVEDSQRRAGMTRDEIKARLLDLNRRRVS